MNPRTRLIDGAGTDFERLLLDSARDDAAPLASRHHVAARLGVDLARAGASLDTARSAPNSDGVRLTKAGVEATSTSALVKCTLIAVIGGLSAVSTASEVEAVRAPLPVEAVEAVEPHVMAAVPATGMLPAAHAEPAKPAQAPMPTEAPERTRVPERRAHRSLAAIKARPVSDAPIERRTTDPLLLEVQQLDRVRAAFGSGRNLEALRALDEYEDEFPRGALSLEATVLRVRTLERAGRFGNAARLARRALELPDNERYRSELARIAGGEDDALDKSDRRSTLDEPR